MATPSYVSAGSVTRGVDSSETSINISSFRERFENPKDYILDRFGGRTGFATDFDASTVIAVEGEVSTANDAILGAAFATAMTIANQTDGYGITTGDNLLDDIEITMDRGSKKSTSLNLTRVEGLTVA